MALPLHTCFQRSASGRENSPALELSSSREEPSGACVPSHRPPTPLLWLLWGPGAEARLQPPLCSGPRPVQPRDCPWLLLASIGNDFSVLRPLRSAPLSPSSGRGSSHCPPPGSPGAPRRPSPLCTAAARPAHTCTPHRTFTPLWPGQPWKP